jgi:hypothetical protein
LSLALSGLFSVHGLRRNEKQAATERLLVGAVNDLVDSVAGVGRAILAPMRGAPRRWPDRRCGGRTPGSYVVYSGRSFGSSPDRAIHAGPGTLASCFGL